MEDNYTVYKHIFPNNKVYIGITYRKPIERWNDKYRGCPRMKNAIKKYGWENVKHEILYEHLTKEEAEQKEIELIAQYKSNQKEYGYNISNGGNHKGKCSQETKRKISEAKIGHFVSLETRKKISENCKGNKAWNKGLPMPIETKLKLSLSLKGKQAWNKGLPMGDEVKEKLSKSHKGKPSPRIGKHLSTQTKRKISEAKIGSKHSKDAIFKMIKNSKNAKSVICIETNKIYSSARQCALDMGLERSSITRVCNGQLRQTGSYHFEWYNNKTEYNVANAILG